MSSVTETLREALESKKKKNTPHLIELKKCAGRAKTRLFQVKHAKLRFYYAEECAKSGVTIVKRGSNAAPKGEPAGKDRYKITMRAYGNAQNKIRQEFYDLYLEFYNEELSKAGIYAKPYRSSIDLIKKLQAEVSRLETLLAKERSEKINKDLS